MPAPISSNRAQMPSAKAEAAVEAQQAVTKAKQELAAAQAALASAKDTGSASPSGSAGTSSPKPLAPAATVDRVRQADSEFKTVQQGVTDETPLSQASEQFNAAAVALEMTWLRLFADAGCLTDGQQVQAEAAVRDYTTALQQSLRDTGYYDGEVDGVYGPATVDAIESLQKAHGLPVTGTVDKATASALQDDLAAKGGAIAQDAVASTAAVQQTLRLAGFWDGPVDGQWTPELTKALKDVPDRARGETDGNRRRGDHRGSGEGDRHGTVSSLRHPVRHPVGNPFPLERDELADDLEPWGGVKQVWCAGSSEAPRPWSSDREGARAHSRSDDPGRRRRRSGPTGE